MNETTQPEIVVGVSGSRASVAALRWAADEALRRQARLSVVCAWDHRLRPAVPPDGIEAELAQGVPERVLIDRSAIAALLVLGAARPQDAHGLSVGPVLRACLSRACCPVVVVSATAGPDAGQRPDSLRAARESALTG